MILLITGSRTFCEAAPDKPRDDYMAERMALGFALDMIGPTAIVAPGDTGATRWARIWAERRGVDVTAGRADATVVFGPEVGIPTSDLPRYEVSINGST